MLNILWYIETRQKAGSYSELVLVACCWYRIWPARGHAIPTVLNAVSPIKRTNKHSQNNMRSTTASLLSITASLSRASTKQHCPGNEKEKFCNYFCRSKPFLCWFFYGVQKHLNIFHITKVHKISVKLQNGQIKVVHSTHVLCFRI